MQVTAGSGAGGSGGGLARFRSAPTSWLDTLLEDDVDSTKLSGPHQGGLTQLLTAGIIADEPEDTVTESKPYIQTAADSAFFDSGGGGRGGAQEGNGGGFYRMNSSPADFLSGNVDGYFSSFGIPSTLDFSAGSSGKRVRDSDSEHPSSNFSNHRRGELSATANGLLDLEMEKLLEDSVPCRVRAKRGFATHPRSIAERVRRTKISDRIRRLQDLVPNMDKQTNTSEMLDEAVEYVKTLQKQIQELTEQQKNCKCMAKS